jgi:acetolactate synthase I/II/III large subunit
MDEPSVDFAAMARSMGVEAFGPVVEPSAVRPAMDQAVAAIADGRPALVDVRISPR